MATVRPTWPARAQPGADLVGEREQAAPDHRRVGDVGVEGHLGADRLLHVLGRRPGAGRGPRPARAGGRRPPRRARRAACPIGASASSPTVRQARAGAASRRPARPRPTARRPAAGAGSRAPGRPGRRSRRRAWPGWSRAWPRTWSARPRPSRSAAAPRRSGARMPRAIAAGRPSSRWAPATSRNASSSESGSTSGVTSRKIAMTARGGGRVRGEVGRQEHRLRAQRPGPHGRHRAADAVPPGLVAGRADHAARARPRRPRRACRAARAGARTSTDGEERVHVDVQDRAARVVGVRPEPRVTAPRHRWPGCVPRQQASPGYDTPPTTTRVSRAISSGTVISAAVTDPW